jgi:hypothetical protein
MSRSVLGWNQRAVFVNSIGTLITTLPQYGLRAYIHGVVGNTKVEIRRARRAALTAFVNAAERRGYLKAHEAEAARKLIPLLLDEVYAEAAGVSQGEAQAARERFRDVMEGRDPRVQRVLRMLGPYGMFSAREGVNRTIDILAADYYARNNRKLDRRVPEMYESLQQAREEFQRAMMEPGSAEGFSANAVSATQFSYNALGVPVWANGPFGKLFFQLATWPLNYAQRMVMAPAEGLIRTAAAVVAGKKAATLGQRGVRSGPDPANWFERWMEEHGAGFEERHAAAAFTRQIAVSAVLLGLTAKIGWNIAVAGVAPSAVAGLWLLRQFFPDDDALLEYLKTGKQAQALNPNRGLPFGPVISTTYEAYQKYGRRLEHAGTAEGRKRENVGVDTYFPWDLVLHAVRRMLNPGDVAQQRLVREHYELFDRDGLRWALKFYNIKRGQKLGKPGQTLRHHLGLTTAAEDRRNEGRVSK